MQNLNSKLQTDLKSRCYKFGLEVIRLTDTFPQSCRKKGRIMDKDCEKMHPPIVVELIQRARKK